MRWFCQRAAARALIVVAGLSSACASMNGVDPVPNSPENILAACAEHHPEPDVSTWQCDDLLLVESVVTSATEREVFVAFDGFVESFGGANAKRVDSVYSSGRMRRFAVRVDGESPNGAAIDAQMVAIPSPSGMRLVACSSKSPNLRCSPAVAALLGDAHF